MPFNLGIGELLLVMVIFLLVFGAKRLPEIGAAMGKGIREFKRSINENSRAYWNNDFFVFFCFLLFLFEEFMLAGLFSLLG